MTHSSVCSCFTCDADGYIAAAALTRGDYETYESYLARYHKKRGGLRVAASNDDFELRVGIHYPEANMKEDFTPPNSYDLALKQLRTATPSSSFAERYAADRKREFAAEHAAALRAAERPALRVLTAAELKSYEPPNPYTVALAKIGSDGR